LSRVVMAHQSGASTIGIGVDERPRAHGPTTVTSSPSMTSASPTTSGLASGARARRWLIRTLVAAETCSSAGIPAESVRYPRHQRSRDQPLLNLVLAVRRSYR
jgi:hypothetical protein